MKSSSACHSKNKYLTAKKQPFAMTSLSASQFAKRAHIAVASYGVNAIAARKEISK
jgi:hypothetical protein